MPSVQMEDSVLAGLAAWGRAAFTGFAHAAAPAAVAALWQDALVALALVLCMRFVLRVSAAHRFAAWAAGFAVAVLLPFLEHSGTAISVTPASAITARPWLELDSRWGIAIAAFWLAASTFRAAELVFHSLRLSRLWHGATPVEVAGNLRSLLDPAWPTRRIEVCTTSDLDRPSVIGFFAPRILIPEWLYSRLTQGELEQVILHEAEHLRRRDDWTNLLQKISLILFPLNPALAWMERRLCREREMACDEGVVQRTQAPRAYAACLAALAERGIERSEFLRRAQALSLGILGRRPELVRRVESILRRKQPLHPLAAGALVGVVGCGLLVGAIELSRSPQLVAFVAAQKSDMQTAALAPPETPGIARISHGRTHETSPAADDAVFQPSERYRAIETKSIVPAKSSAAVTSIVARSRRNDDSVASGDETAMTDRGAAPHQVMVNAASTPAASSPSQEFIVLTAWEEVKTSVPQSFGTKSREVADYETGADAQTHSDDAASERNTSTVAQISVTRLILLVVPANTATGSPAGAATGTRPARTTGSRSHRPTAAAFDGGWLFFQL